MGDELTLGEIQSISASLGTLLWLAFSGGEIFLREDIVDITRTFYKRNRPAIILFSSNGLLTDVIEEKIAAILKSCTKSTIAVKLSLDGTEHMHDAVRGKGSFHKTMQTYRALGELMNTYPNLEVGINTVFCSENQDSMSEIIEFVRGLDKIKTHTVSLIRGKGLEEIDLEKYRATINQLAANLRSRASGTYSFAGARLKAAQDILQRRLIYEIETQKRQLLACFAGKLNLVVTEQGDLYPCESFTMPMGNVRDNNFNIGKMVKSSKSLNILRSIKDKGCFCSHECYLMTNILFNIRMYPRLLKEYLQLPGN
jgi:radical SAM protein with 4Fe4S-binding SPASM domain